MRLNTPLFYKSLILAAATSLHAGDVAVKDRAELVKALQEAGPGTVIAVASGNYEGGISVSKRSGEKGKPIVIKAADPERPPVFDGGQSGIHLSGCSWIELSNLRFSGAMVNGMNIDDGGSRESPAKGIVLRKIIVTNSAPKGNRDGIKMSGVDAFTVVDCRVERWGAGGSAIDMVGCHDGTVEGCVFEHDPQISLQANGVQTKGGSSGIVIRKCRFIGAGGRGVNIGGSTGADYMRPPNPGYEARDITVEDCYFANIMAPVAFVGVDGALVRHNTLYHPGKWALRILQENRDPNFVACRKGVFSVNLIVFRSSELSEAVNAGGGTEPSGFSFARNAWFCEDKPEESQRRIRLPAAEKDGVYGVDPKLRNPANGDYRRVPGNGASQAGVREAGYPVSPGPEK